MIDDELLSKFDRIEDLPFSEEMLGAYIEGNLRGAEMREIQNLINDDNLVADFSSMIEDDLTSQTGVDFGLLCPQNIDCFFAAIENVDVSSHDLSFIDVDFLAGNQNSYFSEIMHECDNNFQYDDLQILGSKEFDNDNTSNELDNLE